MILQSPRRAINHVDFRVDYFNPPLAPDHLDCRTTLTVNQPSRYRSKTDRSVRGPVRQDRLAIFCRLRQARAAFPELNLSADLETLRAPLGASTPPSPPNEIKMVMREERHAPAHPELLKCASWSTRQRMSPCPVHGPRCCTYTVAVVFWAHRSLTTWQSRKAFTLNAVVVSVDCPSSEHSAHLAA